MSGVVVEPDQITAGPLGDLWFTTTSTATVNGRETGGIRGLMGSSWLDRGRLPTMAV